MNRKRKMKTCSPCLTVGALALAALLTVSCDQKGQPGEHWNFAIQGDKSAGNVTWDLDGVTIVFEGEHFDGNGGGRLQVGGQVGAIMHTYGGSKDIGFSHQYADEINFLRFREHEFMLLHGGRILYFEGTSIELGPDKKRVTVKTDGSLEIEEI